MKIVLPDRAIETHSQKSCKLVNDTVGGREVVRLETFSIAFLRGTANVKLQFRV